MNYLEISKSAVEKLYGAYGELKKSPLDAKVRTLVELRVSQINGCAYCCNVHAKEAREAGFSDKQLDELPGWRSSALFAKEEIAALKWAEEVTYMTEDLPEARKELEAHFSEREIVDLTLVISLMNGFNRMAVSLKH